MRAANAVDEICALSQQSTMISNERTLLWPDCYNTRDLGGLPTVDGRVTASGAIVRSDTPARLTAAGQQMLIDYGIRTIIDLRRPDQVAEEPTCSFSTNLTDLPHGLNISLEQHSADVDELIRQAGAQRAEVYRITVDHNQQAVAQIMKTVANAPEGGILLHCSAGKDRTGIVAALLLTVVGVPDTLIAEDYVLSQKQLWPLYETLVQEAGGEERVGWWLKPVTTPAMILSLLAHLDERYGGVINYLIHAGVSMKTQAQIRTRLLRPNS